MPQAYAYASGRPLVMTDPTGRRPGALYDTPELAARAALDENLRSSFADNKEYSGVVYRFSGETRCTYTPALKGDPSSSPGPALIREDVRVGRLLKRPSGLCGEEPAEILGWWHTHGNFSDEWYKFSLKDIQISLTEGTPAYVGTPAGALLYFGGRVGDRPQRLRPDLANGLPAPPGSVPAGGYWN